MPTRLVILVALLGFLSAIPGQASCSWLLWSREFNKEEPHLPWVWEVASAFPGRQSCLENLGEFIGALKKTLKVKYMVIETLQPEGRKHLVAIDQSTWKTVMGTDFVCLPDTITPRK
jgi:hypothetical protein